MEVDYRTAMLTMVFPDKTNRLYSINFQDKFRKFIPVSKP